MCEYRKDNQCNITNGVCPWVYYCDKIEAWAESSKAPKKCKVVERMEAPKGYNKVEYAKHGYLYIRVDNEIIRLANPYEEVPMFVKVYKSRGEWKLKKENKGNEGN